MNRLAHNLTLTDVDRQRLGTLLTRADMQAVGRSRLRSKLEGKLEDADNIAAAQAPSTLVTMNSKVVLREVGSGEPHTCTLVYPEDREITDGGVSVLQDLGCSMLGHRVGEMIDVKAPTHLKRYVIQDLLYQPETVGASWL